jgi:hypothetical protein
MTVTQRSTGGTAADVGLESAPLSYCMSRTALVLPGFLRRAKLENAAVELKEDDTELQGLGPSSLMRLAAHDHRDHAGNYVCRQFLPWCPGTLTQSALPSPDLRKARVAQFFACVRHRSGMLCSARRRYASSKLCYSSNPTAFGALF